jgi:hypothetical protein
VLDFFISGRSIAGGLLLSEFFNLLVLPLLKNFKFIHNIVYIYGIIRDWGGQERGGEEGEEAVQRYNYIG